MITSCFTAKEVRLAARQVVEQIDEERKQRRQSIERNMAERQRSIWERLFGRSIMSPIEYDLCHIHREGERAKAKALLDAASVIPGEYSVFLNEKEIRLVYLGLVICREKGIDTAPRR